ncbi:MAG: GH39 family glycosyl hydrolase [Terriglobales bacterium]
MKVHWWRGSARRIAGLVFVIGLVLPAVAAAPPSVSAARTIVVPTRAATTPFPHFWEQMFGSGRALLSLRQSYRRDLTTVHRATGFRYIRFHGIFDRGVGVFHLNAQGQPVYNWSYVDQIYDGLLASGVRPFVELSFMPPALAANATRQAFFYRPYIAPPKNWNQWAALIQAFARHLVHRYGLGEVAQWYFEVWNEPNISFWAGQPKQATYFHLYDVTARALKSVSPLLRVGGPATAQAAWVPAFLAHCARRHVPVDFVSTHVYGNDSPRSVLGIAGPVSRRDMVALAVAKVHRQVAASAYPHLPIIFSEYNASYMNEPDVTDSAYMGPWLAGTIRRCAGKVQIMSYWAFSDVFEEQGVIRTPFYGGFGLIAEDHIPKAAFNDFVLLHQLGDRRLPVASQSVLATRRATGGYAVAAWNYAPVGGQGPVKRVILRFAGLGAGYRALVQMVDRRHGDPRPLWIQMGSPRTLSRRQVRQLRRAAQLGPPQARALGPGDTVSLTLPPEALALVTVTR